jgi:hypothetical protein
MRTVTLEEHFLARAFVDEVGMSVDGASHVPVRELGDGGENRPRDMDNGGIEVQMLSHAAFGDTRPDAEQQRRYTAAANDQAVAAIAAHPDSPRSSHSRWLTPPQRCANYRAQ